MRLRVVARVRRDERAEDGVGRLLGVRDAIVGTRSDRQAEDAEMYCLRESASMGLDARVEDRGACSH